MALKSKTILAVKTDSKTLFKKLYLRAFKVRVVIYVIREEVLTSIEPGRNESKKLNPSPGYFSLVKRAILTFPLNHDLIT